MLAIETCEDRQLLEAFVRDQSDQAFRQIVELHGRWIFAAAYRQLHDSHLAQDAAQVVFILLARRAGAIPPGPRLSGWLFNTLQYTVKNMLRARKSRVKHEQGAAALRQTASDESRGDLTDLAMQLDGAVARLTQADRTAILLRFYQDCSFEQIAATLGISEEAARQRVSRGVTRLRKLLGAHADADGLSATAALGLGLAPVHLTQTLTTVALGAKAGAALPFTLTTAMKGTEWLMTQTKIKAIAVLISASLLVAVPATFAAIHYMTPRGVPGSSATVSPPVTVPVALDTTAPADTTGDLAQFNRIYALDKNQDVKRVAPPFVDTRQAALESIAQQQRQALSGGVQAVGASSGGMVRGGGVTMGTGGRGGGRRTAINGGPVGGTQGATPGGPPPS